MNSCMYAIKAEWIKGRRTFLRYSPVVFAFLALLIIMPIQLKHIANYPPRISIAIDFVGNYFMLWTYLMLPIYCIFIAMLNFYTEHTQGLWKHINVQPVSGTMQTLVKHYYAWCYLSIATVMLSALIVITLLIIKLIYSELNMGLNDITTWLTFCQMSLGAIAGGVTIVSILNLIAARFSGFISTLTVGFIGLMLPFLIKITDPVTPFIPWMIEKFVSII